MNVLDLDECPGSDSIPMRLSASNYGGRILIASKAEQIQPTYHAHPGPPWQSGRLNSPMVAEEVPLVARREAAVKAGRRPPAGLGLDGGTATRSGTPQSIRTSARRSWLHTSSLQTDATSSSPTSTSHTRAATTAARITWIVRRRPTARYFTSRRRGTDRIQPERPQRVRHGARPPRLTAEIG